MSFVHYEPDPAVVPCIGCDQRILEDDLVQVSPDQLGAPTTFFWYPFHFWCVCKSSWTSRRHCIDCGLALDRDALRSTLAWSVTYQKRVTLRCFTATGTSWFRRPVHTNPSARIPRPRGLRMVVVPRAHSAALAEEQSELLRELGPGVHVQFHSTYGFAVAHDVCPLGDPFVDGLVANGPSGERLAVYQDALLEVGDALKAEFVGVVRERLKANRRKRRELTEWLRELRDQLPGTWCRAVLVGDGSAVRGLE